MAAVSPVGSVIDGGNKRSASERARDEFEAGARKAADEVRGVSDLYKPYTEAGANALNLYQDYLSGKAPVETSPEYAYQSGLLKQRLAATGENLAPTANSAYFTPLIAQESANRYSRLAPLMSAGQFGVVGQGNASRSLADIYSGVGTARSQYETNNYMPIGDMIGSGIAAYQGIANHNSVEEMRKALNAKNKPQAPQVNLSDNYGVDLVPLGSGMGYQGRSPFYG
jgi:hypothetical protein